MTRVGVTGHRILAELEKVERGVEEALRRIELGSGCAQLTIISSLAEGADRMVALHALARTNAKLIVPLPLSKSDYSTDFKNPESSAEFFSLLDRAEEVIEMPPAATRDEAYEAAGNYVLDHSDVLITIWDGRQAQGRGGTGAMVARARQMRMPIAWVHAGNREPITHKATSLGSDQGLLTFENFPAA